MSQFHFLAGRGRIGQRLGRQVDAVCRRHGADFTWATLPGDGPRYWASAPNYGAPFDAEVARAVRADLTAAGLRLPGDTEVSP